MRKLTKLAALAALVITGTASAATITGDNLVGGAITDLSTVTFDIVIGTSGTVSGVSVRFDLTHTQVGDLQITLTNAVGDVTRDLVYRLGGDTYNRNYSGEYSFSDANTGGTYSGDFWAAAAAAAGTNSAVTPGAYLASTIMGTQVFLDTEFAGSEALGTWTLTVHDLRSSNIGTLNNWHLELETGSAPPPPPAVPEPSTYILFGLGLGGIAALRRKR